MAGYCFIYYQRINLNLQVTARTVSGYGPFQCQWNSKKTARWVLDTAYLGEIFLLDPEWRTDCPRGLLIALLLAARGEGGDPQEVGRKPRTARHLWRKLRTARRFAHFFGITATIILCRQTIFSHALGKGFKVQSWSLLRPASKQWFLPLFRIHNPVSTDADQPVKKSLLTWHQGFPAGNRVGYCKACSSQQTT